LSAYCCIYSMLAGPHPHSLSRGDFASRSGRRRCCRCLCVWSPLSYLLTSDS
jgi:hypothetical protein